LGVTANDLGLYLLAFLVSHGAYSDDEITRPFVKTVPLYLSSIYSFTKSHFTHSAVGHLEITRSTLIRGPIDRIMTFDLDL